MTQIHNLDRLFCYHHFFGYQKIVIFQELILTTEQISNFQKHFSFGYRRKRYRFFNCISNFQEDTTLRTEMSIKFILIKPLYEWYFTTWGGSCFGYLNFNMMYIAVGENHQRQWRVDNWTGYWWQFLTLLNK